MGKTSNRDRVEVPEKGLFKHEFGTYSDEKGVLHTYSNVSKEENIISNEDFNKIEFFVLNLSDLSNDSHDINETYELRLVTAGIVDEDRRTKGVLFSEKFHELSLVATKEVDVRVLQKGREIYENIIDDMIEKLRGIYDKPFFTSKEISIHRTNIENWSEKTKNYIDFMGCNKTQKLTKIPELEDLDEYFDISHKTDRQKFVEEKFYELNSKYDLNMFKAFGSGPLVLEFYCNSRDAVDLELNASYNIFIVDLKENAFESFENWVSEAKDGELSLYNASEILKKYC